MENSINFNPFLLSHTPPVSSTSQGECQVGKGQPSSQDLLKLPKGNRKNRKRKCRFAAGKWTLEEQKDYMDFIDKYSEIMEQREARRSEKIFKSMSGIIKTRNAQQCRTHHQKMLQYHNNLKEIILLRNHIEKKMVLQEEKKKEVLIKQQEWKYKVKPIEIFTEGNRIRIYIRTDAIREYRF